MEIRGNFLQKAITDLIVLCKPSLDKSSYKDIISNFRDKLIFIPKKEKCISPDDYIPCLFYRKKNSNNFLIYFHGNSENIFQIEYYGLDFRSYLNINVIMVEYPGYFLKTSKNYDSNLIFSESLIIYDWIKTQFKALDSQIFICGRSLGTSPAIYLSAHRKPEALFLISPFTSIKNIGSDKYLSFFVEEIFKSIDYIKDVKCSILFIHGLKDPLISYHHSEELYKITKKYNNNFIDIKIIKEMTHNDFVLKDDIIEPIIQFMEKIKNKNENEIENREEKITEDVDLYEMPIEVKRIIEAYIFDIRQFEIENNLEKNNASILAKISGEKIVIINDSKITIYNHRFFIDNEINLSELKNKKEKIESMYETKDRNLIFACREGDIFKIKIEKRKFTLINIFSFEDEILKLGKFYEDYICVLTRNKIILFDSSFSKEILSINKDKDVKDYYLFDKQGLTLIKNETISLNKFEKNSIIKEREISLKSFGINTLINTPLIGTNEYLIIGGIGQIIFIDTINNFKIESKLFNEGNKGDIKEEIIYMSKIHDYFILGSTNYGQIIQINIEEEGTKTIISKFMKNMPIFCVLMINYESLLISGNNEIDIVSIIQKKEKKEDKNCIIF